MIAFHTTLVRFFARSFFSNRFVQKFQRTLHLWIRYVEILPTRRYLFDFPSVQTSQLAFVFYRYFWMVHVWFVNRVNVVEKFCVFFSLIKFRALWNETIHYFTIDFFEMIFWCFMTYPRKFVSATTVYNRVTE